MNLENMFSEISHAQKDKHSMISLIHGVPLCKVYNGYLGLGGLEKEDGEMLVEGYKISVQKEA